MIFVDTREQEPIWEFGENGVMKQKLDEGDYTTEELFNVAHIERKSGRDLYGSIIQGHERFRNELKRANEKGIKLAIFVECEKEKFIYKRFPGGFKLKSPPTTLRKIVTTISDRYGVEFVWCRDRNDFREKALQWFERQRSLCLESSRTGPGEHDIQGCQDPGSSPV